MILDIGSNSTIYGCFAEFFWPKVICKSDDILSMWNVSQDSCAVLDPVRKIFRVKLGYANFERSDW